MSASSAAPDAYRDYYREIERHWSWQRGMLIIVSPVEFEAINEWYEAEVPLAVVLRAIDVFIERKNKNKRKRPFLLTHIAGDVEKVHREYASLHGKGEGEEEDLLMQKLQALAKKLKKVAKNHPESRGFIDALIESMFTLKVDEATSFEAVEKMVEEHERQMVVYFTELLDDETRAAIREEAEELLSEEEDPEFFQKIVGSGVREHFLLPRLTIIG